MSPIRDFSVCVGAGFGLRLNRIGRLGSGSPGARSLEAEVLEAAVLAASPLRTLPHGSIDDLDVGLRYFLRRLRFLGELFS